MKLISVFIALLLLLSYLQAQPNTSKNKAADSSSTFSWLAFPYIFFTPETNFAIGVGGILYFRPSGKIKLKPSKITFSGYYSIDNQYSIDVTPSIYFKGEKYFTSLNFNYARQIDKFYGIGNSTEEIGDEDIILRNLLLRLRIRIAVMKNIEAGIVYEYSDKNIEDPKNNPFLINKTVRGYEGGLQSGPGITLAWDTRDNLFYPSTGGFYEARAVFISRAFGSDFDFNKYIFNLRHYFSVADNHILAVQFYSSLVGGFPPFYELSELGGSSRMRGYFKGRFRDRNYIALQAEYRTIVIWKIGFAAFFALGDVSNELSEMKMKDLKYSYGFGLRYVLDTEEKLNVRVDFGFGKNTSGVYFSIEEAF